MSRLSPRQSSLPTSSRGPTRDEGGAVEHRGVRRRLATIVLCRVKLRPRTQVTARWRCWRDRHSTCPRVDLNGNNPEIAGVGKGGLAKVCKCSSGGTSKGGRGGDLTIAVDGEPGETKMAVADPSGNRRCAEHRRPATQRVSTQQTGIQCPLRSRCALAATSSEALKPLVGRGPTVLLESLGRQAKAEAEQAQRPLHLHLAAAVVVRAEVVARPLEAEALLAEAASRCCTEFPRHA